MIKKPLLATTLAVALSTGSSLGAFEVDQMTVAEREAFRAEVRAYLLDNPEVLMEAMEVLEERQAALQAAGDRALVEAYLAQLTEDGHSWVGGNPEGDITIVEFLDYRCGFCKRAHPEIEALMASDPNIRLVVKEFPILGPGSNLASRFAIAVRALAGDDAYKQVHDTLMTLRGEISGPSLARLAEDLGLDYNVVQAEMDSADTAAIITKNQRLAQALQITGTPTFVVGGQMLRGFLPLDGMREVVATERSEG